MKYCILLNVVLIMSPPSAVIIADDVIPTYTIYRSGAPLIIDGQLDEPAWRAALPVGQFQFAWHKEGEKEQTIARLLWDEKYLYVSFRCVDAYISGENSERDSPVYRDDCVELFTAPDFENIDRYFNFEMNVRGALLDDYHSQRAGHLDSYDAGQKKHAWNSKGIRIAVQIIGTLNDDSDRDQYWVLEAAIPLSNFKDVAPPRLIHSENRSLVELGAWKIRRLPSTAGRRILPVDHHRRASRTRSQATAC